MKALSFLPTFDHSSRVHLGRIARSCGYEFEDFSDSHDLMDCLDRQKGAKTVLLVKGNDAALLDTIHTRAPWVSIIVMVDHEDLLGPAPKVSTTLPIQSFIATRVPDLHGVDLGTPLHKIRSKDIFGLRHYLGPNTDIFSFDVTCSDSKEQALNALGRFITWVGDPMEKYSLMDEYARRVCEIADELLLNSVFVLNKSFAQPETATSFILNPFEKVSIQWGYNAGLFGLSVEDRFGLLKRETVLEHLWPRAEIPDVEARESGGWGLRLVFKRVHHLIINVAPGSRTEIICLLKLEDRLRDFKQVPKSLHFFST